MQDPLFTVDLPLVNTNSELEKIKSLFPNYDPYFIVSGCKKDRREKFESLWARFRPYADSHFRIQIKTNFHQRSWEMYIGNVLLVKNLLIQSKDEGPDFIVNDNFYIECVACTKGDKNKSDSVPEMYIATTPNQIRWQDVPTDKMILRITQVIKDKAIEQYGKWKDKKWFNEKVPFIIAINTGDLEYPQDYLGIPLIIKALFGLEFMKISQSGSKSFSWRKVIKKEGGIDVQVNFFTDNNFDFVSGALFSDKLLLNHPKNIGDDCIFINNPFAKNLLDKDFIKLFRNWYAKVENGIKLTKNY